MEMSEEMKRKIVVVAVAILIIASAIIWINSSDNQIELNNQAASLPVYDDGGYDLYMERAQTQEQKDALLALKKNPSDEGWGRWKRDALEIIGELPKGSRRIKLEDAERINLKFNEEYAIIQAFNKIAGAPDYEGGSGTAHTTYYTNKSHTEGFLVVYNRITHIVVNEKGERIINPLESDLPTPKPYQTTSPNIKPIID
jgi:hypothetical protein